MDRASSPSCAIRRKPTRYVAWNRSLAGLITVTGFGTLLAGCSAGGAPSASALSTSLQSSRAIDNSVTLPHARRRTQRETKPAAFVDIARVEKSGKNVLALSDSDANAVFVSDASGGLDATLTNGLNEPQGLALDANGALYVANTGDSQVLVYPKPYDGAPATLNDPGQFPAAVAVAADGTVGVTNITSTTGGAGSVSIYAKGATSPCVTVNNGSFARLYFDAFDKAGNLYVNGTDASGRFVAGEVSGECGAGSIAPLSVDNTIHSPGGVAVLANGNISLGEPAGRNVTSIIYTYKPPSNGSLGAPQRRQR